MKLKNKLPKKFKVLWIKALKSGKYTQSVATLLSEEIDIQDSNPHCCCIGVAAIVCGVPQADIMAKGLLCTSEYLEEPEIFEEIKKKVPTILIGEMYNNSTDYNPIVAKLANFNDKGKSFKWIAAYIKRYL